MNALSGLSTNEKKSVIRLLSRLPGSMLLVVLLLLVLCAGSISAARADGPSVFDVVDFSARALDDVGNDFTVAGGHPYEADGVISFATIGGSPVEPVKDVFTELPPGFLASLAALPRCSSSQLAGGLAPNCPPGSQVGVLYVGVAGNPPAASPLYNMIPDRGFPASLAFKVAGNPIVTYVQLGPRSSHYGGIVAVPGAGDIGITSLGLTVYGVPSERNGFGGPRVPVLSNPADCLVAQPATRLIVDSWRHPGRMRADGSPDLSDPRWKTKTSTAPPVTGCDAPALASQFTPRLELRPTSGSGTSQADAPSGYTVDLDFPQTNDQTDSTSTFDSSVPAAPALKDATVTLPAGVAISPSAANGLDGCSDEGPSDQVHYDSTVPVTCPDASKVGTVSGTSPLLAEHDPDTDVVTGAKSVGGDVFIVKPHPGDLSPSGDQDGQFRLLLEVNDPQDGVNVKIPGVVTADHATGRLTGRFEDNPQLPVKHLTLVFKPGDRAALVNPPSCTSAKTTGVFTPWSRGGTRSDGVVVPGTPNATSSSSFEVSWDGQGAGCPATLPFAPVVQAGLADAQAGGSSPFMYDLTREDRQDIISGVDVALPGGLLAAVKDVPLCSDGDADAGVCPAASRVGSASVAAGAGGSPFYLTGQPVSLTSPYKGAPYGLAIAVHAVAGPFDLGTVVVRQALNIDPTDAHATVVSDPLPTMRDGVPFRVRRIHVSVNRPGFMRSPTSCEAKTIASSISSLGGQTANLSTPLQASGCGKLPFAPKLSIKLTGASQAKVGGHPGVEALVTQRPGESAMKSVTVTLPLSLALDPDNAESDSLCEFADGLKDQCPAKSVIGTVTAVSPLLKTPLNGKVYFVKGVRTDPKSGRLIKTLPTLLIELRGEINVNLRATSSVPDGKHLTSTFSTIPDAPISSFLLKLNGGEKGILVVTDGHDDLCYAPQKPFLSAVGQNGKRVDTTTTLTPECPLAVVSRTFTKDSVRVRVSGIGAGTVTIAGRGINTVRRTIASATSATITAKLTAAGKRMRRAKQDVRIKATFTAKGTKKPKAVYSATPRKVAG